ncbi:hypothetical protein C0030_004160 [Candidatus Liberibacter solanacearum]|uniref:Uncharacterized protein n=1 Tax=Candidatus Liberibacter solanacearum TaxID=556287 RepID=A0A3R7TJ21_9HYPH|nr:hypothetical protein [Candidatus Liberibacter solanacearum]RPD37131.1 hypothetical protein C0030_004160 [Candidatus Liberibacter solanacearum]
MGEELGTELSYRQAKANETYTKIIKKGESFTKEREAVEKGERSDESEIELYKAKAAFAKASYKYIKANFEFIKAFDIYHYYTLNLKESYDPYEEELSKTRGDKRKQLDRFYFASEKEYIAFEKKYYAIKIKT